MANTYSQIYIQTVFAACLKKFEISFEEKYIF